jgi:predicted dehydrogenase
MKSRPPEPKLSRRRFLLSTGTMLAFPTMVPASALGRENRPAPSKRITLGAVGCGGMGSSNIQAFLAQKDCQVVAACDVDKHHLQAAVNLINQHYDNRDCKAYRDYRELMARGDIDAVMLAVPDHWHALPAIEAARTKKDIYGEKPLARTIAEQQAILKAVQANGRIWQTGSWQRSQAVFRKAAEIVRNGLIGRVTRVEVGLPAGHRDSGGTTPSLLKKLGVAREKAEYLATIVPGTPAWKAAVTTPPPELDFDLWLGPSRTEPYIHARIHKNWRWNYNTGGGQLMDWVGHHCDIAHWGCDFDNAGPSEVEGHGDFPPADAIWNTCTKYRIELKYPRDIHMTIAGGHADIRGGTKWIGTDGWVFVSRGVFEASNEEWRDYRDLPEELRKVKLYQSSDHHRNFLDCVKSRQPTITPAETAHHSAIPGHLGLISMLLGRKLKWDASAERILEDADASKLLSRGYRAPWSLG